MPQVIIRRPFGELDLCDQLGSWTECGRRQSGLSLIDGENNSILASPLGFLPSLNHLVRPIQQRLRNRQADLLGCFQIDDELELLRLLHRKIGGLGAF